MQFMNLHGIWSRMWEFCTNWSGVYKYDLEDEAQRLLKEVKIAIEMVQESRFYAKLLEQIHSAAFQDQLKSFLGSHSKLKMVIYALGSMEFSYHSQYQLAIALLLGKDCSWIEGIEVYDPQFSPADITVLKELGCEVLALNERCRRKVERPTLFYMPYAFTDLVENLIEANWCPSQINQVMFLGYRLKHLPEYIIKTISEYIKEIVIEENYGVCDGIFCRFAWSFFGVDPQLNMENLLTGKLSKRWLLMKRRMCDIEEPYNFFENESIAENTFTGAFAKDVINYDDDWTCIYGEYRGPRMYRCSTKPPPKGWIKLNISGRGCNGESPAGYGGICQNEFNKTTLSYNGALGQVDDHTACVEALKHGLIELSRKYAHHKNLIVAGDDLKVIHWLNKWHVPPEEIRPAALDEVLDSLRKFNSVVYNIYEEANSRAKSLAKKGASLGTSKKGLPCRSS